MCRSRFLFLALPFLFLTSFYYKWYQLRILHSLWISIIFFFLYIHYFFTRNLIYSFFSFFFCRRLLHFSSMILLYRPCLFIFSFSSFWVTLLLSLQPRPLLIPLEMKPIVHTLMVYYSRRWCDKVLTDF